MAEAEEVLEAAASYAEMDDYFVKIFFLMVGMMSGLRLAAAACLLYC